MYVNIRYEIMYLNSTSYCEGKIKPVLTKQTTVFSSYMTPLTQQGTLFFLRAESARLFFVCFLLEVLFLIKHHGNSSINLGKLTQDTYFKSLLFSNMITCYNQ